MNTYLLGGLVLALVLALAGLLLQRRRPRQPAPLARREATPLDDALQPLPPATRAAILPDRDAPSAEAQRQAATEALRQARRRKAEEAARLQVQRQADAQAQAVARARDPQPLPPSTPEAPLASAAQRPPPMRAAAVQAAAPAALPLRAPPAPVAPVVAPARPRGPHTVLLADDSKVVRVKTGRLLEKQGWRVLLAEDGLSALRHLDAEAPDLLITDVEMPGLDGFGLTRHLRAHPRWSRLPVIMITSSDDKHRDEARAAGVDLLLGKPYAEETLLAHAQQMLGIAEGLALH